MKIESNVAVPLSPTEVLKAMQVGDSVLAEDGDINTSKLYMAARLAPKRMGYKFRARSTPDGLRIWRIA